MVCNFCNEMFRSYFKVVFKHSSINQFFIIYFVHSYTSRRSGALVILELVFSVMWEHWRTTQNSRLSHSFFGNCTLDQMWNRGWRKRGLCWYLSTNHRRNDGAIRYLFLVVDFNQLSYAVTLANRRWNRVGT